MPGQWHKLHNETISAQVVFPPPSADAALAGNVDAVQCSVGITNQTPSGTFNCTFSAQRLSDDVWVPLVTYKFGSSSKAPDIYGTGQRECPIIEIPPGQYDKVGISILGSFSSDEFICEILARVS